MVVEMLEYIYQLSYDLDWGSRGNRRNVIWYKNKRLPKNQTIKFIKQELNIEYINEMAYDWTRIKFDKLYMVTYGG